MCGGKRGGGGKPDDLHLLGLGAQLVDAHLPHHGVVGVGPKRLVDVVLDLAPRRVDACKDEEKLVR